MVGFGISSVTGFLWGGQSFLHRFPGNSALLCFVSFRDGLFKFQIIIAENILELECPYFIIDFTKM